MINKMKETLFNFHDLDLRGVLEDLKARGYKLDSIGLMGIRSLVDSKTVCGFKSPNGYLYISFFYGEKERILLVKTISSKERLSNIEIQGISVPLQEYDGNLQTFVRGFDIKDFTRYSLL